VKSGTAHSDDHAYLMNLTFCEDSASGEDGKQFMEMMLDLWTSFADFENM